MQILYSIYFFSLYLTAAVGIVMACVLGFKAEVREGKLPLVLLCLAVPAWAAGFLLIHSGKASGAILINASPVAAAFFVHFALGLTDYHKRNVFIVFGYIIAAGAFLTTVALSGGDIGPWLRFTHFYKFNDASFIAAGTAVFLWALGSLFLMAGKENAEPRLKRQIGAVLFACVLGLVTAVSFVFGALDINIFPYTAFVFPAFPTALAYGVLRYESRAVNKWACKSVAFALTGAVIFIVLTASAEILALARFHWPYPAFLWQTISIAFTSALLAMLVRPMADEFAVGIVYPGSNLNEKLLSRWQAELEKAGDWRELSDTATNLVCAHAGQTIEVRALPSGPELYSNKPGILCAKDNGKEWGFKLSGWEHAAPATVYVAEAMAALVVKASDRLEDSMRLAERERMLSEKEHLEELARLSGLANKEAKAQKLFKDLAEYCAKPGADKRDLNVKEEVEHALGYYAGKPAEVTVDVPRDLFVSVDKEGLNRVFFNLLDNAYAALNGKNGGRIMIHAFSEPGGVKIRFSNNGPEVPPSMKSEIFKPFVSASPSGYGLGLATAKRIMEANGGSVALAKGYNWPCCFELFFPAESYAPYKDRSTGGASHNPS